MKTMQYMNEAMEKLRHARDTQLIIPCNKECMCNEFDLILDSIQVLQVKFIDAINADIKELEWDLEIVSDSSDLRGIRHHIERLKLQKGI